MPGSFELGIARVFFLIEDPGPEHGRKRILRVLQNPPVVNPDHIFVQPLPETFVQFLDWNDMAMELPRRSLPERRVLPLVVADLSQNGNDDCTSMLASRTLHCMVGAGTRTNRVLISSESNSLEVQLHPVI